MNIETLIIPNLVIYREAVILRYIEQYSVKKTAQILNTTETNVKNDTARALKALRALLGGERDV